MAAPTILRTSESNIRSDICADFVRYGWPAAVLNTTFWSLLVFRLGTWIDSGNRIRVIFRPLNVLGVFVTRNISGLEIHKTAKIGPGAFFPHPGTIIIGSGSIIGANATIRHNVTIGNRYPGGPCPRIGDDTELGVGCAILGGCVVGDAAVIGAMTLVIGDIPAGATAVGIPARIVA